MDNRKRTTQKCDSSFLIPINQLNQLDDTILQKLYTIEFSILYRKQKIVRYLIAIILVIR